MLGFSESAFAEYRQWAEDDATVPGTVFSWLYGLYPIRYTPLWQYPVWPDPVGGAIRGEGFGVSDTALKAAVTGNV